VSAAPGVGSDTTRDARCATDPLALPLRVGLLVLLLDASLFWFERVPVTLLAATGLLLPGALRARSLWAALLLLTTWPLFWNWPFSDNHDYLRALFCLAVWGALCSRDPVRTLAVSARALVGLTFLFATLWKVVLSPEFIDATFFRVSLLTDTRFQSLAVLAGGMTREAWEANDLVLGAYLSGEGAWEGFSEPAALRRLALALTVFTAGIEGLIALAFLWPGRRGPARAADALLLLFAVTTFAFATVRGFGWLLAALGLAQCGPARRRTRLAYVAALLLLEVYHHVPWSRLLVEALGRG
jgi:hypothetical protein